MQIGSRLGLALGGRLGPVAPLGSVLALLAVAEATAEAPQDEVVAGARGDWQGPVAVVAPVQDSPAGDVGDVEDLLGPRFGLLAQPAADPAEEQLPAGELLAQADVEGHIAGIDVEAEV